jgi:hypothetical protein
VESSNALHYRAEFTLAVECDDGRCRMPVCSSKNATMHFDVLVHWQLKANAANAYRRIWRNMPLKVKFHADERGKACRWMRQIMTGTLY